jgi:hypothetical protein
MSSKYRNKTKRYGKKGKTQVFKWPDAAKGLRRMIIGNAISQAKTLEENNELEDWLYLMFSDAGTTLSEGINYIIETLSPITQADVKIDILKWIADGAEILPSGVIRECATFATGDSFHDQMWHLYNQACYIKSVMEDEGKMFIDMSGTLADKVFNNEDVVYYSRDRLHLVDLTVNPDIKTAKLVMSTEDLGTLTQTYGNRAMGRDTKVDLADIADTFRADGKLPLTVRTYTAGGLIRDITKELLDGKSTKATSMLGTILALAHKIPTGKVTYTIEKIPFSKYKYIRDDPKDIKRSPAWCDKLVLDMADAIAESGIKYSTRDIVRAVAARVATGSKPVKKKIFKPPAQLSRAAKGTADLSGIVEVIESLRKNGYAALIDKMHECYQYCDTQTLLTKGIPPPSDVYEKGTAKIPIVDSPHSHIAFLNFLTYSTKCKPGVVYTMSDYSFDPVDQRNVAFGYIEYGVQGHQIWGKRVKPVEQKGRFRDTIGVIKLGCSRSGPKWLIDALTRGAETPTKATPWTPTKRTDYNLAMQIAGDRAEVGHFAAVNKATFPNVFDRAKKVINSADDDGPAHQRAKQDSKRALTLLSSTIAGQMLSMNALVAESAMNACKKKGGEDAFHFTVRGENLAFLTKVVSPIAHFKGTNVVVFVRNACNVNTSYISHQTMKKNGNLLTTKALFVDSKFIRHAAYSPSKVANVLANTLTTANVESQLTDGSLYLTTATMAMIAVNARRSFGVSLYAARWMGNITAGVAGDLNSVAGKVMYGTCTNRFEAMIIAESVILRHAASSLIRDEWNRGKHITTAVDDTRVLEVSPPGTWGFTLTFEGYISAWYNAEITHGMNADGDLFNARAFVEALKIVVESAQPANQELTTGIPAEYIDPMKASTASMISTLGSEDFKSACIDHAVATSLSSNKFAWSFYTTIAAAQEKPIPDPLWNAIVKDIQLSDMSEVMTSKRAHVETGERSAPSSTDVASVAFSLPLTSKEKGSYRSDRSKLAGIATATTYAASSGGALRAVVQSLMSGDPGYAQLVDKADSIEKMRIVAMMDVTLRWAAWVIEKPAMIALTAANSCTYGYENPRSALLKKDKARVIDSLANRAKANYTTDVEGARITQTIQVPIMNDCSSWGPMKNLPATYAASRVKGMPTPLARITRLAYEVFMTRRIRSTAQVYENASRVYSSLRAGAKKHNMKLPVETGPVHVSSIDLPFGEIMDPLYVDYTAEYAHDEDDMEITGNCSEEYYAVYKNGVLTLPEDKESKA